MKGQKRHLERDWQIFLSKSFYPCDLEVKTPVGNIDILTPTQLIEIKASKNWKAAIGQLQSYATYYPHHQKHLYLFGDLGVESLAIVKSICDEHKIWLSISFQEIPLSCSLKVTTLSIKKS